MIAADFSQLQLGEPLAVLVSGGLDSAVLLGLAARQMASVHPLYVRCGLHWEEVELSYLRRFLAALKARQVQKLVVLELPVRDLYGEHWSVYGRQVPDADSPDEAVYLPGRNVFLLSKALLWCHLHKVPVLALGTLRGNPFADATPEFMAAIAAVVNQACEARLRIVQPLRHLDKAEVVALGRDLPLVWTFSCLSPQGELHCGSCNKCGERRRAFAACGVPDPTPYAEPRTEVG